MRLGIGRIKLRCGTEVNDGLGQVLLQVESAEIVVSDPTIGIARDDIGEQRHLAVVDERPLPREHAEHRQHARRRGWPQ